MHARSENDKLASLRAEPARGTAVGVARRHRTQRFMIGVVIVTHGGLAGEFLAALEHVVGRQRQIEAISIGADDDCECRRRDITAAVERVDSGDGTILLTDLFGGTPSNLSVSALASPDVAVIAGVNLPMLIKLACVRRDSRLDDAARLACDAGRKCIRIAREVVAAQ